MQKHSIRLLSLFLCSALVLPATTYNADPVEDAADQGATYSIASTLTTKTSSDSDTADTTAEDEPYQSLQWALNNDGTFSLDLTDWYSNDPLTDGGTYDGGGFMNPDVIYDGVDPTYPDDTYNGIDITYPDDTYDGIDTTYPDGGNGFSFYFDSSQGWQNGGFHNISFWDSNGYGYSIDLSFGSDSSASINDFLNSFFGGDYESLFYGLSNKNRNTYVQTYYETAAAIADVDTDAVEAWELFPNGGDEVIVAVIDTGLDYTHEDLADAIWTNTAEIAGDKIDNDNNGYIDDVYGWNFYGDNTKVYRTRNTSEYDHGTHVAGTIAAQVNDLGIAGLASNANVKIMTLRALGGNEGTGTTEDIIAAIEYAEAMGATICNLSFGTTEDDPALKAAIAASNMLFICAAGNGDSRGIGYDTDATPLYPASYNLDNIISVANLVYDGTLDSSSNYGKASVDIAAPGTDILSTTAANTYSYLSGTSMSAPMVTAVAAMLASYNNTLTLSEIKNIIIKSAVPVTGFSEVLVSGGTLNAYNALVLAGSN